MILRTIRSFLDSRDFLEVETPVMSHSAGSSSFFSPHAKRLMNEVVPWQLRFARDLSH